MTRTTVRVLPAFSAIAALLLLAGCSRSGSGSSTTADTTGGAVAVSSRSSSSVVADAGPLTEPVPAPGQEEQAPPAQDGDVDYPPAVGPDGQAGSVSSGGFTQPVPRPGGSTSSQGSRGAQQGGTEGIRPVSGVVQLYLQPDRLEAQPGDTVRIGLAVQNNSTIELKNAEIFAYFNPSHMSVRSAGGGTLGGGTVSWTVDSIPAGRTRTLTYTVRLSELLPHGSSVAVGAGLRGGNLQNTSTGETHLRIIRNLPQTGVKLEQ